MRKYRVLAGRLNIRAIPGATDKSLGILTRNMEFWSNEEQRRNPRQLWATVCDHNGIPRGWACVHDNLTRYCEEVPMPVSVAPELPPMPENPGGLDLMGKVIELEHRIRTLENIAGIGK